MVLVAGSNTIDGAHGSLHVGVWLGDGPPLVAIHGVDGNHAAWAPLAEHLDGERTVVAVDLRGRGDSTPSGPFGVGAHAADLKRVIDETAAAFPSVEWSGVDLIAHSFGCHVAARAAADHPSAVHALILVDGGPPRQVPEGTTAEQLVAGAIGNIVANLEAKDYPVSVEAVETDFASMVLDPIGSNALFDVEAPVHLLRAELGVAPGLPPVVPDDVVADLVRAGVALSHEVIAGATHFSILGAPELVTAARLS